MEIIDRREEVASALTHGIGVAASAVGGAVLVGLAWPTGEVWEIVGAVVFSATLLLLYSASTVYHAARDLALRARLQVLDHCAIFLLIAGTYTPFTLVSLRGPWGWTLFGTVWTFALAGVVFKLFFTGRYRRLSTGLYLGMGWLVVVAARPLLEALPFGVLAWMAVGGLCYTAGTLFYHSNRVPYAHAIWHLFVLGGSACHFVAVLSQIAPSA
jgi:hemolysin III